MNIDRLNPQSGDAAVTRSQQTRETTKPDDTVAKAARPRRDQVSLSDQARHMEAAMRATAAAPDVREEKVARIREQLANGTYAVSDEDLARALLRSIAGNAPAS